MKNCSTLIIQNKKKIGITNSFAFKTKTKFR